MKIDRTVLPVFVKHAGADILWQWFNEGDSYADNRAAEDIFWAMFESLDEKQRISLISGARPQSRAQPQ